MYNLTNLSNTTGIVDVFQVVNTELLSGWFGTLLLIGLSVVIFLGFYFSTGESNKSVAATAFISFILSVLMAGLQLIPAKILFITLIIASVGVAFLWKKD